MACSYTSTYTQERVEGEVSKVDLPMHVELMPSNKYVGRFVSVQTDVLHVAILDRIWAP